MSKKIIEKFKRLNSQIHLLKLIFTVKIRFLRLPFCYSCSHRNWHFRRRGEPSNASLRLFNSSVQISATFITGAWPLVVFAHVQVPALLFLQEFRFHSVPFLVCVFLRIQCSSMLFESNYFVVVIIHIYCSTCGPNKYFPHSWVGNKVYARS